MLKHNSGSLTIPEFEQLINETAIKLLVDRADEVELSQKRIDDLSSLKRFTHLFPTNIPGNLLDFEDPAVQAGQRLLDYTQTTTHKYGYLRALAVGVEWDYKDNPCFPDGVPIVASDDMVDWIPVKPMKSDKRYEVPRDYYNRPTDERPYYDFLSIAPSKKVMKVINRTPSRVSRIRLEYLEYPAVIVVKQPLNLNLVTDIDFPLHMRQELVDLALTIVLERQQSQRVRSQIETEMMTKT